MLPHMGSEQYSLKSEVKEQMGDLGVIGDKVAVIAGEPQEGVDVSGVFGHWPVCYTA